MAPPSVGPTISPSDVAALKVADTVLEELGPMWRVMAFINGMVGTVANARPTPMSSMPANRHTHSTQPFSAGAGVPNSGVGPITRNATDKMTKPTKITLTGAPRPLSANAPATGARKM